MIRRAGLALAVALLALVVYAPVGGFSFVSFDDPGYVTANELVLRGLTADGVRRAFTGFITGNWHPVTWISHMADVSLFGAAPSSAGAHHLVSAALHAVNAALLFLFLLSATGGVAPSWVAAALFAVHPIHVESVAWVAERKDVLAFLFAMLALLAYVAYTRRGGAWRYALVALALSAGLMSKATVVTVPLLLLLLDAWPLGRVPLRGAPGPAAVNPFPRVTWGRAILEKLPLVALSVLASLATVLAQRSWEAVSGLLDVPFSLRLSNAAVSYVAYLGKAAWPSGLSPLYSLPVSIPAWKAAGAASLLLALTAAAVLLGRRRPGIAVGWFWFVAALVPMIGLVQVGRQAMADRYAYLPFVGLYIASAFTGWDLAGRGGRRGRLALLVAAAGILCVLTVAARGQLSHWKDTGALFGRLASVSPGDAWYNAGSGWLLQGNAAEAEKAFRRAIALSPRHVRSRGALASVLTKSGRVPEAIPLLREAVRLEPDYLQGWYDLGDALRRGGDPGSALGTYEAVLARHPDDPVALLSAGLLRIQRGEVDAGLGMLRRAVRRAPDERVALRALRDTARGAGREAVAREAEDRLQRLGPGGD